MKLFVGKIEEGKAHINEEEQQHITKVLRMREGEEICVTDGKGNLAKGNLAFEGKRVNLNVTDIQQDMPINFPKLHIAIAPTKNIDRTEFFVEKATEMGISEITFINSENSERKNINLERIVKQSVAASKQSLRFYFPKINNLVKLQDFIQQVDAKQTLVAHCHKDFERKNLDEMKLMAASENALTILIGPEGDFSEKEIKLMTEKNIHALSLGSQRLRTETAGIFVSAWFCGNFTK